MDLFGLPVLLNNLKHYSNNMKFYRQLKESKLEEKRDPTSHHKFWIYINTQALTSGPSCF